MMRFTGKEVLEQFTATFGIQPEDMTPEQVMFFVKFSKHIRGRCRNNAALKNHLVSSFPNMTFRDVQKEWKGRSYTALQITSRTKSHLPAVDEGADEEE